MTVVCGYVPTPEGRAGLDAAIDTAKLRGEDLVVLNTRHGEAPVDPRYATDDDIAEVRQILEGSGVPFALEQEATGQGPAADLLSLATERGASIIVIGLRRRTPTGKLLFGSTAQQILLEAEVPVLAVKA
ncbi:MULTISPECIES: universal stress protein [unclassified Ornithinimicrobium]|uniref:universal stress protein n=1 Tax=unclassified Ornithinimicrobium TaxID=2615080 RepID=UPI00385442A4